MLVRGLSGKQFLAQVIRIFETSDVSNEISYFYFFVKYFERVYQKERNRYGQNHSDFVNNFTPNIVGLLVRTVPLMRLGFVSQDSIADIAFVVPSFLNNLNSSYFSKQR